jgi:hypothetical protein
MDERTGIFQVGTGEECGVVGRKLEGDASVPRLLTSLMLPFMLK